MEYKEGIKRNLIVELEDKINQQEMEPERGIDCWEEKHESEGRWEKEMQEEQ